jgi:hypothetical protein
MGEWVDPTLVTLPVPKLAEPEVSSGSWVTSSFDLLSGTDVSERAMTPELFNAMFRRKMNDPEAPPK